MEPEGVENRFEPQVTVQLPEQYAKFNKLNSFVEDLKDIEKNRAFYDEVYNSAWIVLCMEIDALKHNELIGELRNGNQDAEEDERRNNTSEFWENLESESVYPIFNNIRKQHAEE